MEVQEARKKRQTLENDLLRIVLLYEQETKLTVAAINLKHAQSYTTPARVVELSVDVRV
jgi:hypothetical protein